MGSSALQKPGTTVDVAFAVPARTQVFEVLSGKLLGGCSQGHYGLVNCCAVNPMTQELYTGACDSQVRACGTCMPWTSQHCCMLISVRECAVARSVSERGHACMEVVLQTQYGTALTGAHHAHGVLHKLAQPHTYMDGLRDTCCGMTVSKVHACAACA